MKGVPHPTHLRCNDLARSRPRAPHCSRRPHWQRWLMTHAGGIFTMSPSFIGGVAPATVVLAAGGGAPGLANMCGGAFTGKDWAFDSADASSSSGAAFKGGGWAFDSAADAS
mmetsp:Transcript_38029/g.107454  ORF Transcript_38029/g.107454 Transcript_38029/m.107454 type:complete len:112 (+) Transcript_38029:178-513(+)